MSSPLDTAHSSLPLVAAVVVTYDRPVELQLVVAALLGQSHPLDVIIIFDNGGPVAAADVLTGCPDTIKIIRSPENLGGAGGFAAGLTQAMRLNANWIWLMDDDAIPEAGALAALLAVMPSLPERTGALCCAVQEHGVIALQHRRCFDRWFGGERTISLDRYGQLPQRIDIGSFVGFLVAAQAVRDIGLPNPDFFLAYDDTEYSLRLQTAGWLLWLVPWSLTSHLRPASARLRTSQFGPKHYFNIRNRLVVKRRYARFPLVAAATGIGFACLLWLLTPGLTRPGTLRLLLRALADGLHNRLGPFPVELKPS